MSKAYWNYEQEVVMNEQAVAMWKHLTAPADYQKYIKVRPYTRPTFEEYCDRVLFEYRTPYEQLMARLEHMQAMQTIVQNLNDEGAYMHWILEVPDEPSTEDLLDIADDDEQLNDVCGLFRRLIANYGMFGFCLGDTKAWGAKKEEC